MRVAQIARRLAFGALVLGSSMMAGCKSYHYYDVQVKFASGFTESDAGMIQLCTLYVTGAATDGFTFPDNDSKGAPTCPVQDNWPVLGTFEYSTFEDAGDFNFLVSAYSAPSPSQANCFASGALSMSASDEITQNGTLTLSMGTDGCAH